jgi:hypothetical protein
MKRTWLASVALLAGGALAGGVVAGTLSANAASGSSTTSTTNSTGPTRPTGPAPPGEGARGAPQGTAPDETLLTGTQEATLKAAALKAVPGGTVDRVETDSGDATYEVHMTKSDGTQVTVKFDSSLKEVSVENGMGK